MADKTDNKKQAYAKAKSIRTSGQKLNLVAKSIRGCNIKVAIDQLTFSKKRVSREVLKVLNSAIANAENNFGLDIDKLVVAEAYVGKSLRVVGSIEKFDVRSKMVLLSQLCPSKIKKVFLRINTSSLDPQAINSGGFRKGSLFMFIGELTNGRLLRDKSYCSLKN